MNSALRSRLRRLFYRSPFCRKAIGWVSVLTGRTEPLEIHHLVSYRNSGTIGPLQRDEALALYGIIRAACPKVLVEFGFLHGESAFNFLCAIDPEARLFSYDISDHSAICAATEFTQDPRFTFIHKSQTDFDPVDIDGLTIDFVFLDAAHELALNMQTFERILPSLAPDAIIAVHDTGLWAKAHFRAPHSRIADAAPNQWITDDAFAHQPEERAFIDWVRDIHPEFAAINLHTNRKLRHGLTLLQRQCSLPALKN